jgi:hypothetical protein
MSEANPDPSGTTGEFRAFVERGAAERGRRRGMRKPVVVGLAVLAAVVVIAVIAVIVVAVG